MDLLKQVSTLLENKVEPIIKALEEADPTTKEYGQLLDNYNATMTILSAINKTLILAAKAKEEIKNESNN